MCQLLPSAFGLCVPIVAMCFCHVQHIWMVDSKGLITTKRRPDGNHLPSHKRLMARDDEEPIKELKDVIAHVKPHALIGLSAAGPSWHEVRACSGDGSAPQVSENDHVFDATPHALLRLSVFEQRPLRIRSMPTRLSAQNCFQAIPWRGLHGQVVHA